MRITYLLLLLTCTACSSDTDKGFDNLEDIKKDFISAILYMFTSLLRWEVNKLIV